MNKNIVGVGIAIISIVAIIGVVLANMPAGTNNDSPSTHQSGNSDMSGVDMKDSDESKGISSEEDLTDQTEVTIDISDFEFNKKSIKISKGTKVTWTNRDTAKHNVFSKDGGGPRGELLAQGETFEYTFDKVGSFDYICEPHPYMKGTVNVTE